MFWPFYFYVLLLLQCNGPQFLMSYAPYKSSTIYEIIIQKIAGCNFHVCQIQQYSPSLRIRKELALPSHIFFFTHVDSPRWCTVRNIAVSTCTLALPVCSSHCSWHWVAGESYIIYHWSRITDWSVSFLKNFASNLYSTLVRFTTDNNIILLSHHWNGRASSCCSFHML